MDILGSIVAGICIALVFTCIVGTCIWAIHAKQEDAINNYLSNFGKDVSEEKSPEHCILDSVHNNGPIVKLYIRGKLIDDHHSCMDFFHCLSSFGYHEATYDIQDKHVISYLSNGKPIKIYDIWYSYTDNLGDSRTKKLTRIQITKLSQFNHECEINNFDKWENITHLAVLFKNGIYKKLI